MGILRYSKAVKGAGVTGDVFVDVSPDVFRTRAASLVKWRSRWSTAGKIRMKSCSLTHPPIT